MSNSNKDPEIEQQIRAFGENMRVVRRRAGMTQTQLAAVDGLDRAAISLTEKGRRSPDMRTLLRIAAGLKVTPAELLEGIGGYDRADSSAGASSGGSGAGVRSAGGRSAGVRSGRSGSSAGGSRFGENLLQARRRSGISQQVLGAHADVDAAAISLYERGQRQPNLRTILKLARTLQTSPAQLLHRVR